MNVKEKLERLGFKIRERECEIQKFIINSLVNEDLMYEASEELLEKVEEFKNPLKIYGSYLIRDLSNEDMIPNIKKAGKMIREYIKDNKYILFLTDYDCDGAISAGCISKLMNNYKDYYNYNIKINKRKYGNGINKPFIDNISKEIDLKKVDLIVTADHGVGSIPYLCELLREYNNLKIIITDHHIQIHQVDKDVEDRMIIVDAHNVEGDSIAKKLSGACIAALTMINSIVDISDSNHSVIRCWELIKSVSDILGMAVLSDVMDISVIFNRFLVKLGLERINSGESDIFNYISSLLYKGHNFSIDDLRFNIIPIINSGNRMHKEECLEDLFIRHNSLKLTEDELREKSINAILQLHQANKQRKTITNAVINTYRDKESEEKNKNGIVLSLNIDLGINGIIAGKIGEIEQKPTACFISSHDDKEILHGSLRSIIGVNLLEILETMKIEGIVEAYGGHKEACGCSIKKENFKRFENRFPELCPKVDNKKLQEIDIVLDCDKINSDLANKIKTLEPYGNEFKEPIIYSEFLVRDTFMYRPDKTIATRTYGSFMVDDNSYNIENDGLRVLKFIALRNSKYDLEDVFRDLSRVGCGFTFKDEKITDGKTPTLVIKYGVRLIGEE